MIKAIHFLLGIFFFVSIQQTFASELPQAKKMIPSPLTAQYGVQYEVVQGADIEQYIDDMARLRLAIFRKSPYFYDGTETEEREYLSQYLLCENAVFVVAKAGPHVIGAISGMPLKEREDSLEVFLKNEIPVDSIFYLGELVVEERHSTDLIVKELYQALENHVKSLSLYDQITECVVIHPDTYLFNYPFERMGAVKHPELVACFFWKEIDQEDSSPHFMEYWIKNIR